MVRLEGKFPARAVDRTFQNPRKAGVGRISVCVLFQKPFDRTSVYHTTYLLRQIAEPVGKHLSKEGDGRLDQPSTARAVRNLALENMFYQHI